MQPPLGRAEIELDHFLPRPVPDVGHLGADLNYSVFRPGLQDLQSKAGVGQAEAEGIANPLRRARQGLEIPVAHIDILGVFHIVCGVVEMLRGWVVVQVPGKGVRQLAAGIGLSGQQGGDGASALHTALIGQQHGGNPVVLIEPGDVHDAAHVQHHGHPVKGGADLVHHGALSVRQVIIPLGEDPLGPLGHKHLVGPHIVFVLGNHGNPVPALAGEAAEDDHGGIRMFPRRGQQFHRKLRLRHQSGDVPGGIALRDISPVVVRKGFVDENALLFQPVADIADICAGHVAAASSAFYIVETALSEQSHPAAGGQGEQTVSVFQQHHALLGGLPGEGDVFRAGRHAAFAVEGQVGLIAGANPFFHVRSLLAVVTP